MGNTPSHSEPFKDLQSTAEATAQIKRWITPSTTFSEAIKLLVSRGFFCRAVIPQSKSVKSSFLCSYSPSLPPKQPLITAAMPVHWGIILDSQNGIIITDIQLARFPEETSDSRTLVFPKPTGE